MYCRFCGEQVPNDTRFCPNCYNPCGFENPSTTQNISNNHRMRSTNRKPQTNNSDSYSPYAPVNSSPFYQSNMYVNLNNSKYCKGCHNMIDKRSKRCHICGKKQKSNIGVVLCIPFIFIFMFIFVIGLSSSPSNNIVNSNNVTSEIITLGGNFDESGKVYIYMNGDNSEYREGLRQEDGFEGWCFYRLPVGEYIVIEVSSKKGCLVYSMCDISGGYDLKGSLISNKAIKGVWGLSSVIMTDYWYSGDSAYSINTSFMTEGNELFFIQDGYIKLKRVT